MAVMSRTTGPGNADVSVGFDATQVSCWLNNLNPTAKFYLYQWNTSNNDLYYFKPAVCRLTTIRNGFYLSSICTYQTEFHPYITAQSCLRSECDEENSSLKNDKYHPCYGNAYFPFYLQKYWNAFKVSNEKKILNTYSSIQLKIIDNTITANWLWYDLWIFQS